MLNARALPVRLAHPRRPASRRKIALLGAPYGIKVVVVALH